MLFLLGTLHKFIFFCFFFFFKPNCIKKLILSGALFLQIQLELYIHKLNDLITVHRNTKQL